MHHGLGVAALGAALALAACASAPGSAGPTAQPLPKDRSFAQRALDELGRNLYDALASDQPQRVLLGDAEVRVLLVPEAAQRALVQRGAVRGSFHLSLDERAMLRGASYAGICVQEGRAEPALGLLGLRAPGFVFERALLVASEPGGGALASWVEGRFVNTDRGFAVLSLERVEPPRRDHADLELAVCELRAGVYGRRR